MSADCEDVPSMLRRLVDRAAIQDCIVRTCTSLDERDWQAYLDCFSDDAVIAYTHKEGEFTPRVFLETVVKATAEYDVSQHLALNFVIEAANDGASCRTQVVSYFGPQGQSRQGVWRMAAAVYRDRLVRVEGDWRICSRRAEVQWTDGP